MKRFIFIKTLLITLLVTPLMDCYAQQSTEVQSTMNNIVKKHEGTQGVTCMTVTKGNGLELIKMMIKKEFGKEFLKGVTSITLIDYSDASEQTRMNLHKDLDSFLTLLQEFDISEEEQFSDNDYIRCFASASDSGILSDFVIAIEDENAKMLMYMAGKIKIE